MSRVTLYTNAVPNGYPISIALEELGVAYSAVQLSFDKKQQKEPQYLLLNPNGRVPTIVDHGAEDLAVFESSAILLYLADTFDVPERSISFDPVKERKLYYEQLEWMLWIHGGLAPMGEQSGHFLRSFPSPDPVHVSGTDGSTRFAKERMAYPTDRFVAECKRLFSVLERRLSDRDFLVGGRFSLADIRAAPWAWFGPWIGATDVDWSEHPNIKVHLFPLTP